MRHRLNLLNSIKPHSHQLICESLGQGTGHNEEAKAVWALVSNSKEFRINYLHNTQNTSYQTSSY